MMANIYKGAAPFPTVAALCWLLTSLHSAVLADEKTDSSSEDGWTPKATAFANSTSTPFPSASPRNPSTTKSKAQFGRAFHDNRLEGGTSFDLAADYKAAAVSFDSTSASAAPTPVHFHTILKPAPSAPTYNIPFDLTTSGLHSYQQHSHVGRDSGYHYPAPEYLPPLPSSQYLPPVPSIEIASEYQEPEHYYYYNHQTATGNATSSHLEFSTANRLFVQPGKCSNSIEVGRTRDVEVRTALKSDSQKGVCVLMLYTPNQLNKLAISLQAVKGTTNVIPTGTWLETNVKVYAIQAGDIQPIYTKSNFGHNSPALILTRSNNVILSFYVDRAVDFFLDISTYQSLLC